jgi:DNA-binding transcriptional MocR family regulator
MANLINLQLGWPSPSLFPAPQLLNGAGNVLQSSKKTAAALIYGPDAGYLPLREEIAKWLSATYTTSETISSDRICISNGASANLENILAKFTEPGYTRSIWMIEPSYFLACPIFTDAGFGGRLRGVPEDDEGLDVEFLRKALQEVEKGEHPTAPVLKTHARYAKLYKHIIYAVPTFANPSGKTMSLRRRQELVRIAREFDALVVTDDVYDVLRWPVSQDGDSSQLGAVPPRIVDVDRVLDGGPKDQWGNAISNGSFSKIVAPGVRTGWAEGTPDLALALSSVGATKSGGCPSHITASFIHEMLATNQLQDHISKTLIPTYRARYYALFNAIDELLVPLGFKVSTGTPYEVSSAETKTNGHTNRSTNGHSSSRAAGGYFTYLTVPSDVGITVGELAALALEKHNLKFAFGAMMAVEGDKTSDERAKGGYGQGIRLCWAWHPEEEIREGIARLATLTKELKSKS